MDPEENLNGFCEQEEEEDVHAVELKALGVATCVASPAGCCGCLFTVIAVMVGFAVYIRFFPVCLSFNFTDFKVINSEISNDYYQKLLAEDTKFSTLGSESNSRRRLIFEEQDIFGIEERRIRRRLQTELYGYNLWTSKDFYYRAIAAIYLNVFYYSKETNNILTEELLNICHAVEQGIKSFNGYHNHSLIYKETDTKIELLFPGISPLYLESAPGSFLNYIYPQIILGNYVFNGNGDVLTLEGNDIEETIRTYKDVGDLTEFFDFSFDFINVSSKYLAAIYPFGYKNENETKDELYNWVSTYKIGFFDKLGSSVTNKIGIAFADSRGVILENELYYYLAQDLNLAIWSLLLIYIVVYLYCRSFYITSLGLLGVCSSFIPCFAIYHMIWGESFNLVNMVALWVILGIGADDIFVFMSSYRRAPLESVNGTIIPNHLRLAFAYREAGSAMFVTSFTTACSFFSLCLSTINPLPQFGWFLGSLVLCNFVLVMSYFPCILQSYVWFVMACMKFKCHLKCCNKWLSVAVPRPDQYDPKQLDKQQSVKVLKRSSNIAIPAAVNNNTPHTPQSLQKRPSYNRQSSNKFIIPGADYIDEQNNSNIDEQNNSKHSAQSSAPAQLMRQLTRKLDAGGGFSAETHFSDCTNLYFVIMRRGLGVTLIVIVLILTSIFAYTATLITLPQETAKLLPENTNWGAVTTAISKMDIDESQFSGYSTSSGESTGQIIAVTTSKPSIPPTQPRPTYAPTQPSIQPIPSPTPLPTTPIPTPSPTSNTNNPTYLPSKFPSIQPSKNPTPSPVNNPTISPTTINPTITPSINPSISPTTITIEPTINPSSSPTKSPSAPTNTFTPSISPSITTIQPTLSPSIITSQPTSSPSYIPSISPSKNPSITPTITTIIPSITPTKSPSTISPTDTPSITPSITPTNNPSYIPSIAPSTYPSISPTVTTITPSITPTTTPTKSPTFAIPVNPSFKCINSDTLLEQIATGKGLQCTIGTQGKNPDDPFLNSLLDINGVDTKLEPEKIAFVFEGGGLYGENDITGCSISNEQSSFYEETAYISLGEYDVKWCFDSINQVDTTAVNSINFDIIAPFKIPSPPWVRISVWLYYNSTWNQLTNEDNNLWYNYTIVTGYTTAAQVLSIDESISIYLVFGTSYVSEFITDCDGEIISGKITFDNKFNIYNIQSQQRWLQLCNELNNIQDNIMYRNDDDQEKCFAYLFNEYLNNTYDLSLGIFTLTNKTLFNKYISLYVEERSSNSFSNQIYDPRDFDNWFGTKTNVKWFNDNATISWISQTVRTQINKNWGGAAMYEYYLKWQDFINEFNHNSPSSFQGVQTSSAYIRMEVEVAFLDGFVKSVLYTIILCAIVMIFFTQNLYLVLLVCLYILIICIWVVGLFGAVGWPFGIIEIISVPTVVGLTIDYALHITHAYIHSPFPDRIRRAKSAVNDLGSSVFASAMTTISSMLILYFATIIIFSDLGWVVGSTTSFGVVLALFVCPSCLFFTGPEYNQCHFSWFCPHNVNGIKCGKYTFCSNQWHGKKNNIQNQHNKAIELENVQQEEEEEEEGPGPGPGPGAPNNNDSSNNNNDDDDHDDDDDDLPPGWKAVLTDDGNVYYQNDITFETQWTKPEPIAPSLPNKNDNNAISVPPLTTSPKQSEPDHLDDKHKNQFVMQPALPIETGINSEENVATPLVTKGINIDKIINEENKSFDRIEENQLKNENDNIDNDTKIQDNTEYVPPAPAAPSSPEEMVSNKKLMEEAWKINTPGDNKEEQDVELELSVSLDYDPEQPNNEPI